MSKHFEVLLLASASVPLVIELLVGGEVETPIPWNVVVLIAVHACMRKDEALKHATLVTVVVYSWMTFFMHLPKGIACFIPSSAEEWLEPCRKSGLVQNCMQSIETLNRLKKRQESCPTAVLGSSLGVTYQIMVYVFRVIPCCLIAPLKLWKNSLSTSTSSTPLADNAYALSAGIAVCTIIEIATVNVRRLSSLEVVLPFVLAMQLSSGPLKKSILNMGMFYALADFFMRATSTIHRCTGSETTQKQLVRLCETGEQQDCLEGINSLSSLDAEDCPRSDFSTIVMCLASVLKVSLLTVGIIFTKGLDESPLKRADDFPNTERKAQPASSSPSASLTNN